MFPVVCHRHVSIDSGGQRGCLLVVAPASHAPAFHWRHASQGEDGQDVVIDLSGDEPTPPTGAAKKRRVTPAAAPAAAPACGPAALNHRLCNACSGPAPGCRPASLLPVLTKPHALLQAVAAHACESVRRAGRPPKLRRRARRRRARPAPARRRPSRAAEGRRPRRQSTRRMWWPRWRPWTRRPRRCRRLSTRSRMTPAKTAGSSAATTRSRPTRAARSGHISEC